MKKKVLVCGSTGFIGRNLAETLAKRQDLEVYGTYFSRSRPSHPNIKYAYADLTDAKQVNTIIQDMDIIIQAAAKTSGSRDIVNTPHIHVTDNAVMNSILFRAAYDHYIPHLVFFSCTIMYQSSQKPVKEDDFNAGEEIDPRYFGAAWTKLYLEKQCEFYSRLGRNKYTVIRHSNIYGPHDKFDLEHSHVFGATLAKVMNCKDGKIAVWGPGTEKRDLLYISDLVNFVEKAIHVQEQEFELVNVGSGEAVSVRELARKIIRLSGKDIALAHDLSKPHIPFNLALDVTLAKKRFGWNPETTLEAGIRMTMDWYKANVK
jgi:nucleoside-diphosphate-sugar epimerase